MLKDIISISGKGGLYKLVAQSGKGIIVESFEDKKRMMVDQHYQVSSLSDIAIFTETEEKPLQNVLQNIYEIENGQPTKVTHKSPNDELKSYFEKVLPDYDQDRVYVSDIKKVIKWYNILQENKVLKFNKPKKQESKESNNKENKETDKSE
ncbi:MAG: hypothetical protein DRP35_07890 [Candidatus Zixiibacteriota bacterium]|nr:MAG: hypothetical protein DRP35_07890 [candidate division Zixibacteria bacterium]